MALNFADIASKKVENIERPPLPPVGEYRWKVTKVPSQTKTKDEAWEIVEFPVQAVEALDSVEMDDYRGEVTGIRNRVVFMFDTNDEAKFEQTLFNLKRFMESHIRCSEPGMSIAEALNNSVNQEFIGTIRYRQDKNDLEVFYAEIGRTAPVE